MKLFLQIILALMLAREMAAQPNSPDGIVYKSGYSSIMKLGHDLYASLTPKQQEYVSSQPISIETDVTPFIRLLYYPAADKGKAMRGVWISAGFIDLVNNVAHAKAIDGKKHGYFKRYINLLSQESGEKSLRPLPEVENPIYWSDDLLNEQLSNFNSIVGILVGTKLAHHYLNYYEKYKDQLVDAKGNPVPINNLLTPEEWQASFKAGLQNALNSGCTIEGVIPFFEAFDKMKQRPAWVAYFIPPNFNFSKVKKEMEKTQTQFFNKE